MKYLNDEFSMLNYSRFNSKILKGEVDKEIVKRQSELRTAVDKIVEEIERQLIEKALEKSGGVKKKAADLLGISFRSMRYRLEKYDME